MTYPSQSTIRSYGGACPPSYLVTTLAGSYTAGQTFTLASASGWYEVDATGHATTNPLGTSGPFTVVVDFSTATEEKVLCSSVNVSTGVVTVWTDGSLNGRGYDGTTIQAHTTSSTPNCFPVATAVENLQFNAGVNTALTNAASAQSTANTALANAATAQSTANAKVASVTAADSTITIAGTATDPTVKVGTVPYAQVSGTPTSLPPSGSAGGDLSGTYPSPTLATLSPSPAGTYGAGNAIPVVTVDAKGRVTGVSTVTPSTDAPSGPAGGSLAGTYPNPTLSLTGVAANTYGSASTVPAIAVSTEGRITSASSTAIQIAESQVTNLTTDLAGKASTSTTISAGTGLTGGGDLSANRTLAIATLSPSPAGTYGSASVVPAVTVNAQGQVTSVATNTVNDSTKLPLAGGTMSGAIAMGSQRITNLPTPGASTDVARAGDYGMTTPASLHGVNALTYDPAQAAGATIQPTSGVAYFSAIYVPYTMTISRIWAFVNTGGTVGTGATLSLGIYNSTTLLASTTNQASTMALTGALGYTMSTSPTLTPGVYWIGILYVAGTGSAAPTYQKSGQTTNTIVNFNNGNSNTSLLNQRAASSSGRSSLPTDLTALSNITFNNHLYLGAIN